jgi:hypothetical protein
LWPFIFVFSHRHPSLGVDGILAQSTTTLGNKGEQVWGQSKQIERYVGQCTTMSSKANIMHFFWTLLNPVSERARWRLLLWLGKVIVHTNWSMEEGNFEVQGINSHLPRTTFRMSQCPANAAASGTEHPLLSSAFKSAPFFISRATVSTFPAWAARCRAVGSSCLHVGQCHVMCNNIQQGSSCIHVGLCHVMCNHR